MEIVFSFNGQVRQELTDLQVPENEIIALLNAGYAETTLVHATGTYIVDKRTNKILATCRTVDISEAKFSTFHTVQGQDFSP
jgi:phage gp45-like